MLKMLLFVIVALPVLAVLLGQIGLLRGTAPSDLGVHDGKLKPPSKTPNSVSSQADLWPGHPQQAYARIAPLSLPGGAGDGAATMARLKAIVEATPGARIVKAEPHYLYATFETRWMKYQDDVELWFDGRVVQVRSASRLGRSDLGANRQRVEALRARLAAR